MANVSEKTTNYRTLWGPTFKSDGIASEEEWRAYMNLVVDKGARNFANLWYDKAVASNGVPLRKDFSLEELVRHGTYLYMSKYNDDGKWETTFCGTGIVEGVGFDPTGKTMDDFGTKETLKFWHDNLKVMVTECQTFIESYKLEFAKKEFLHCTAVTLPARTGNVDHPDVQMVYEFFTEDCTLWD